MPLLLRSEEHTSELQSPCNLVCRLLLEKKKDKTETPRARTPVVCSTTVSLRRPCYMPPRIHKLCPNAPAIAPHNSCCCVFFFFNDTATTEIYTLSQHDALPILFCASTGGCRTLSPITSRFRPPTRWWPT